MTVYETGWPVRSPWSERARSLLQRARRLWRPVRPSPRPGVGAVVHEDGATFRVWAPHADQVSVAGSFNHWVWGRTPLAREKNGTWSADVPGARAGDEYKYVIRRGDQLLWRTDPYARAIALPPQNALIPPAAARHKATFRPPPVEELVIYELHVGTFNWQPGAPAGTFQGVIDRLPYLNALGVNALELMPVMEFAGHRSWGYNPAHPFAVAQVYGGAKGLRRLVKAAHDHGIAVIVDVVYNHFGPDNLSLWQFDGWHENGHGGIYFYNDWRAETPWAHTRPDFGRPEVRAYIRHNVLMWLEEYQVDGLRWDATAYLRHARGQDGDPAGDLPDGWRLMQGIHAEIHQRFPGRLSIAEDLQGNAWLTRALPDGGAGFHSQWDARFVHPIRAAVIAVDDRQRSMPAVADAIRYRYNDNAFERVIYSESHDEVANGKARVPEEIAPGRTDSLPARKRSALAAVLVFTSPGIPMLFQGQEFLEDGWFDDGRPLDWGKAASNAGMIQLYRDLIRLRRNEEGHTLGLQGQHCHVFRLDDQSKHIAFHRWSRGGPGDNVVVMVNFSHRPVHRLTLGFPHPGAWRVRFNSDWSYYDPGFGDLPLAVVYAEPGAQDGLLPCRGLVSVGPYGAVILSQG